MLAQSEPVVSVGSVDASRANPPQGCPGTLPPPLPPVNAVAPGPARGYDGAGGPGRYLVPGLTQRPGIRGE